jgi:hypothetical protein
MIFIPKEEPSKGLKPFEGFLPVIYILKTAFKIGLADNM